MIQILLWVSSINTNYILDVFVRYKKTLKKEYKLTSKPWKNKHILSDKLLHRYCKAEEKDSIYVQDIYAEYKFTRNSITKMKQESNVEYYRKYLEAYKNKTSSNWKGIRSIVNIQNSSKKILNYWMIKVKTYLTPKRSRNYLLNIMLMLDVMLIVKYLTLTNILKSSKIESEQNLLTNPQEIS